MELNEQEIERYSRQLILKGWGSAQQLRLRSLSVGVASEPAPAAHYLAAAGVGRLLLLGGQPGLAEHLRGLNPLLELISEAPAGGLDWLICSAADWRSAEVGRAARYIVVDQKTDCLYRPQAAGDALTNPTKLPTEVRFTGGTALLACSAVSLLLKELKTEAQSNCK